MLRSSAAMVHPYAWSPDGTKVPAGFNDSVVRVWDGVSGKVVLSLAGHHFGVIGVQWNPDGIRTLTGSEDGTVRLRDAIAGEMTRLFLCFLPDDGVTTLDTPSLSLCSGSGEVWDYLGRSEILTGQLTRMGVKRRQFLSHNPLPKAVAEPPSAEATDEDPTALGPVEEPQVPGESPAPGNTEPSEASEIDPLAEPVVAPFALVAPTR